jgi:hypothetical protein
MNILMHRNNFLRHTPLTALLLAIIFLIPILHSHSAEPKEPGHFLFIFGTSKEMKARLDGTEKAVNSILATGMHGQIHAGDSVGVWALGQDLKTSGFPLQSWNPEQAVLIASKITTFADKQHYAKNTRFELLPSILNRVVQNSERLTVLIFCDGDDKISGTPFDAAINQVFLEKSAQQKKAHEPIIILLRSQLGQYVGCTATLPTMPLTIPEFPPLPEPPAPMAPKVVVAPPPAPVVVGEPLIIIGKTVSNHLPPPVTSTPVVAVVQTNAPVPAPEIVPPVQPVIQTNLPAPATVPIVTNVIVLSPTNLTPATPENSNSRSQGFLLVGAGLIGAALALGLVLVLRPRRKETSLITSSMNDPK